MSKKNWETEYENVYEENRPGDHPTSRRYKRLYSRHTREKDVPELQDAPMRQHEGTWYTCHDNGIQRISLPFTPVENNRMLADHEEESHPSLGVLTLSRGSGECRLHGSEMRHHERFTLTIAKANRVRRFSEYGYYSRENIARVHLTASQLVGIFGNMNNASGVPCTLDWTREDGYFPALRDPPEVDRQRDEVARDMEQISSLVTQMNACMQKLLEAKTIRKGDVKEVAEVLDKLSREVQSNLPFTASQIQGRLKEMVNDAHAEVEALLATAVRNVGLQALAQDPSKLQESLERGVPGLLLEDCSPESKDNP